MAGIVCCATYSIVMHGLHVRRCGCHRSDITWCRQWRVRTATVSRERAIKRELTCVRALVHFVLFIGFASVHCWWNATDS